MSSSTTFGDMMKVPGSYSSLAKEKAEGRDIRVVYSALDALRDGEEQPRQAHRLPRRRLRDDRPDHRRDDPGGQRRGHRRTSRCSRCTRPCPRRCAPSMNDPEVKVNGFILPGHVSTIIGLEPYRFLADEYDVPSVITGFEPVDMLQGVYMLAKQVAEGRAEVEIAYTRGRHAEGNPTRACDDRGGLRAGGRRLARHRRHPGHRARPSARSTRTTTRAKRVPVTPPEAQGDQGLPVRRRAARRGAPVRVQAVRQGVHARAPHRPVHGVVARAAARRTTATPTTGPRSPQHWELERAPSGVRSSRGKEAPCARTTSCSRTGRAAR